MTWHELLFAHWHFVPPVLQRLVPAGLPIDTFEGSAWLGIVPFWMSDVGLRGVPSPGGLSTFPELNVRTYVTLGGKPGVYFFSLDAASVLTVVGARIAFHLPYFYARMSVEHADGWTEYHTKRARNDAMGAIFAGRYRPVGSASESRIGSLEAFLTDRYCLYSVDTRGRIFCCDIDHERWRLQPAELETDSNTMASWIGLTLPDSPPLLHYSERLSVVAWWPQRLKVPLPSAT